MNTSAVNPVKKPRARRAAPPVQVPVIRVLNPFDPRQCVHESVAWKRSKTIAHYFPLGAAEVVISVNGKIVDKKDHATTRLAADDSVVLCPVPAGGDDDGKSILMIVAMIAIAVVSAGAGAAWGPAVGSALGVGTTVGTALVAVGVSIAGSMLVNALLAAPKKSDTGGEKSASYGIDGAKNTSLEGIPVPVAYGTFRSAGNVLGLKTETDTEDNQTLYMLLSAGEGPVGSLTDILINDLPPSSYKTPPEIQIRLGERNQPPIDWFNETVVPVNQGKTLTTSWTNYITASVVDKLRLDFVAPGGLFWTDKKTGSLHEVSVDLAVELRKEGTSTWTPMPVAAINTGSAVIYGQPNELPGYQMDFELRKYFMLDAAGKPVYSDVLMTFGSWTINGAPVTDATMLEYLKTNPPTLVTIMVDDGTGTNYGSEGGTTTGNLVPAPAFIWDAVPVYSTALTMTAKKRSAVRRSFATSRLDAAKYEVRVRRTGEPSTETNVMDIVGISDINEITLDPMSYPNTALVAIKVRLTDQLSGMPTVTYLNSGRRIDVYGPTVANPVDHWHDTNSANPAWIVWDILTNVRYGGAMPMARLDLVAFKEWAAHCDANNLTWNGIVDTEMNCWDATQIVLRPGHAQIVNVGTRYTVVVEKPADPVQMFSVANMITDTYKETWLSTADRANDIDVTFFDRTDNYKQRTVKVYDPGALTAGHKTRNSAITLYGVVDYETAFKEAQFQLNLNRYIRKTVSFSAPLEAVACTVGDLILVQHDMAKWAQGGRFAAGSTATSIKLDRPVPMAAGKQYRLLVTHDAVQRYYGVLTGVVGGSLSLSGYDGLQTVKRIQVAGQDLRVAGTFSGGAGLGVVVDGVSGLAPGMPYTLWDTDVIEEIDIVNAGVQTDTLTPGAPMTFVPQQFGTWMFGETAKVKQPFRVKSVSGSHEYRRDVVAIEYKPEVYNFDRYGINVPTIPPEQGAIGPVRNLTVYEETYVSGPNIVSQVVANWTTPTVGQYAGADVYVKVNDGTLDKVGEAGGRTSWVVAAARGDTVTVRVVAYDLFGKRSNYDLAPQTTYKVIGEISDINVGDVTGVGFTWSGRDCKISWRYNSVTHTYEFGSEPNGGDAGAPDPHFKDYEIRVYAKDGKTLRRTEYTKDNTYTYTYDKNFADGLTRHLVFEIRMRDTFNNLGKPATLDAYNPPPKILDVNVKPSWESATLAYTHSNDPDFAGCIVYLSRHQDDLADVNTAITQSCIVYQGPDSAVLLPKLMFNADYYFRVAAFDTFGADELVPTKLLHFKTTNLDVEAIANGVLAQSKLVPELAKRIDLIDGPITMAGSVSQRLLEEAKARGAMITTVANYLQTATSSVASELHTLTAAVADSAAVIQTALTVTATEAAATADRVDVLAASTGDAFASVYAAQDATTTALQATASDILVVQSNLDTTAAAVSQQINTLATANTATATQINTVTTTLNGQTTTIQTQQQSIDGLSGQYTVKIDNNGYVAGFGLASYPVNGQITSEFIIRADSFAVVMPTYPNIHPFTIGAVNGVPRVIMSSALIGDAAIKTAMIDVAQVNTLSIAGNAVTIPAYVSGNPGTPLYPNDTTDAGSITVTYPEYTTLVLLATWQAEEPEEATGTGIEIYMDGTLCLKSSDSTSSYLMTSHVASGRVAVPAGTHTFVVRFLNDYYRRYWVLRQWSVLFLGVMR